MVQPLVYIVVLNWNGSEETIRCLSSLSALAYPNYRVLIVDNGSTDKSVEQLRGAFPEHEILQTGANLGYAGGNNAGICRALSQGADYVWILNNDTLIEPDALTILVETAKEHPGLVALSPKVVMPGSQASAGADLIWFYGCTMSRYTCDTTHTSKAEPDAQEFSATIATDYLCGCALLLSRQVLSCVGLLDARYFLYFEDTDWSIRARNHGVDLLVVGSAVVHHKPHTSTDKLPSHRTSFYSTRNRLLLASSHPEKANFPAVLAFVVVHLFLSFLRALMRGRTRWAYLRNVAAALLCFLARRFGRAPAWV